MNKVMSLTSAQVNLRCFNQVHPSESLRFTAICTAAEQAHVDLSTAGSDTAQTSSDKERHTTHDQEHQTTWTSTLVINTRCTSKTTAQVQSTALISVYLFEDQLLSC